MIGMRVAGLAAVCGLAAGAAAQSVPATKPLAFDVVSVRESQPPGPDRPPEIGPTADGYRATSIPLMIALLTAYVPVEGGATSFNYGQVIGLPDWANRASYSITAKVGEENLAEWQKPGSQQAMLQAMLQTMFSERFKLTVHREMKEESVQMLVVAKGGPKLKETDPATTPAGMHTPFGGVIVQDRSGMKLYGVTPGGIVPLLSVMMGETIVDKTGLTGKYDIVLKNRESMPRDESVESVVSDELAAMGLKLESGKAPVEKLVIDHIEKPSEN